MPGSERIAAQYHDGGLPVRASHPFNGLDCDVDGVDPIIENHAAVEITDAIPRSRNIPSLVDN